MMSNSATPPTKNPVLIGIAAVVAVVLTIIAKGKMFHGGGVGGPSWLGPVLGILAVAAFCWALYYLKRK